MPAPSQPLARVQSEFSSLENTTLYRSIPERPPSLAPHCSHSERLHPFSGSPLRVLLGYYLPLPSLHQPTIIPAVSSSPMSLCCLTITPGSAPADDSSGSPTFPIQADDYSGVVIFPSRQPTIIPAVSISPYTDNPSRFSDSRRLFGLLLAACWRPRTWRRLSLPPSFLHMSFVISWVHCRLHQRTALVSCSFVSANPGQGGVLPVPPQRSPGDEFSASCSHLFLSWQRRLSRWPYVCPSDDYSAGGTFGSTSSADESSGSDMFSNFT